VNIEICLDWVWKKLTMPNSELDVLVGNRDYNARRFARLRKHSIGVPRFYNGGGSQVIDHDFLKGERARVWGLRHQ